MNDGQDEKWMNEMVSDWNDKKEEYEGNEWGMNRRQDKKWMNESVGESGWMMGELNDEKEEYNVDE